MLRKTKMLAAVAGLVFALAPAAHAVVIYATGFEANEVPPAYVVGHDNLAGQDGWTASGGPWHVQDYAGVGGGIPWSPPSAGGVPPVSMYVPPTNPLGGDQYMGKGTALAGGAGNGGISHYTPMAGGLVKTSIDFLNGPEHDFPLYQGGFFNYDEVDGNNNSLTGLYTRSESGYVQEPEPPRVGGWCPNWRIFDVNGTQMKNMDLGFTFIDEPGFDHLVRATWQRLSWTYDQNTHRITEYTSQDIQNGGPLYVLTNPQALWDNPDDDPDLGPQLTDIYTRGGSAGTNADGVLLVMDKILTYNVGNGSISCFDNINITGDIIPEPVTMSLLMFGGLGLLARRRRRA